MGVSGSFDTDAMRDGAARLAQATELLGRLGGELRGGGLPAPVGEALHKLARKGGDMIRDIKDESGALRQGLDEAATCYEALEQSLVQRFGGAR